MHTHDSAKVRSKPYVRTSDVVRALEKGLAAMPQDLVISAVFPRMIRNLKHYPEIHNTEIAEGSCLYFEMQRVTDRIERLGYSHHDAIRTLVQDVFGGKNPKYSQFHKIIRGELQAVIESVASFLPETQKKPS